MPYQLDPGPAAITAAAPPRTPAPRDDWRTLREQGEQGLAFIDSLLPEHEEVARRDHTITSYDGAEIAARWYEPAADRASHGGPRPGPAVVYLHGGGMIMGS